MAKPISLQKKITRQKKLGNYQKVRKLARRPRATGGLAPRPPAVETGPQQSAVTGSTSEQAATPPPVAPPANNTPPNPLSPTSFNPALGQPDPRDNEYWENYNILMAEAQQGYAGEIQEGSQANIAYNLRLGQEGETQRRTKTSMAEGLIGTGLLRSGAHDRQQIEQDYDYGDLLAGLGREKTDEDSDRANRMKAILDNLGIEEQSLYGEATRRYSDDQEAMAAEQQALAEAAAPAAEAAAAEDNKKRLRTPKQKKKKQRRMNLKAKKAGITGGIGPAKKKKK